MFPAYGDSLSLRHHHWKVAYDRWWPLMTLQVDFYQHSDVQMHLPPPSVRFPLYALHPRSCRHIEHIRQFMAAIVVIRQAPCHQIPKVEY